MAREFTETERLNLLSYRVVGAAIRVHRELGPGLLESAYKACLACELIDAGYSVKSEVPLPLVYRGRELKCGYRLDLLVDDSLVVEVKAIERLDRIHAAQLLSYLRLSKRKLGLLLNFNVNRLDDGIKRVVNRLPE